MFREAEDEWVKELMKDPYLQEITKGDKVLAYYKFPIETNFKNNLVNSLGVFEDPLTF